MPSNQVPHSPRPDQQPVMQSGALPKRTRPEWCRLIGAYAIFYACISAFFAIHLAVVVGTAPSTDGFSNCGLTMGEPRVTGDHLDLRLSGGAVCDQAGQCVGSVDFTRRWSARQTAAALEIVCTVESGDASFSNCVPSGTGGAAPCTPGSTCSAGGNTLTISAASGALAPFGASFEMSRTAASVVGCVITQGGGFEHFGETTLGFRV